MPHKSASWLSRIFTSGSKSRRSASPTPSSLPPSSGNSDANSFLKDIMSVEESECISPNITNERNKKIRQISLSVLDSTVDRAGTSSVKTKIIESPTKRAFLEPVTDDIFSAGSTLQNRKRPIVFDSRPAFTQTTANSAAKRPRSAMTNSILQSDEKCPNNTLLRLYDTTWSGVISSAPYSPTSSSGTNHSLLSYRPDGTTSNSSELSSSTQRILNELKNVCTPAKDLQRMKMLRENAAEKWSPAGRSTKANKIDATYLSSIGEGLSRIQTLSKNMAASSMRKPYWRDLTRKKCDSRAEAPSSPCLSAETKKVISKLHPFFAAKNTGEEPKSKETGKSHPTDNSDKSKSPNTFGLEDESLNFDDDKMYKAKPLSLAPASGFLENLTFSFAVPKDLSISSYNFTTEKERNGDLAGKAEEVTAGPEDDCAAVSTEKEEEKETDADLRESNPLAGKAATESLGPDASTRSPTNGHAEHPKESSWNCTECFTDWPAKTKTCGCCGFDPSKPNVSAEQSKSLVSNLTTFAANAVAKDVTFGFGGATTRFGEKEKSPTSLVNAGVEDKKPAQTPPVAAADPLKNRTDWSCPDCMVQNKADQDNCPCCGFAKYSSSEAGSQSKSTSVFGERAFRAISTNTSTNKGFAFGLSAKPKDNDAAVDPKSLFSLQSQAEPATDRRPDEPSTALFNTEKKILPLFGSSGTKSPFSQTEPNPLKVDMIDSNNVLLAGAPAAAPAKLIFGESTNLKADFSVGEKKPQEFLQEKPFSLFGNSVNPTKGPENLERNGSSLSFGNIAYGFPKSEPFAPSTFAPAPSSFGVSGQPQAPLFGNVLCNSGSIEQAKVAPTFGDDGAPETKRGFFAVAPQPILPSTGPAPFQFGQSGAVNQQSIAPSNNTPFFAQQKSTLFGSDDGQGVAAFPSGIDVSKQTSAGFPSLFGQPLQQQQGQVSYQAPVQDEPRPFQFSASSTVPSTFQFGSNGSSVANQPFVFGSTGASAQQPSAGASFVFNNGGAATNPTSLGGLGGAFSYSSSSGATATGRKLALAKRRIIRK